jgi:hypothetical protein
MKKLIYIILIGLGLLCVTTNNFAQSTTPDKFDIKKFDSEKIYNKQSGVLEVNDTLKDSTTIKRCEYSDGYIEIIQVLNSPIKVTKSYFKNTGNIKTISIEFSGCTIGFWNVYNENGKLVKQTNRDKNYSFSVYDLAEKFKKKFDIDIMHTNQPLFAIILRGYDKFSYYEVSISKRCMCDSRVIRVDGNNGKILSDRIQPYHDGGEH